MREKRVIIPEDLTAFEMGKGRVMTVGREFAPDIGEVFLLDLDGEHFEKRAIAIEICADPDTFLVTIRDPDFPDPTFWQGQNVDCRELPRLAIVRKLPEGYEDKYPFQEGDAVLFLGEIKNMPGHYVLATKDGKVHFGWHDDHFREPTEEEI